ncbi:aminopeptidase [Paraneptunicella aestuarii]|uniref:M1 family metallopeptidase n=1 Tax=Paraneptunicella aestuarii TaxID=2831148 RepID=UPI001E2BA301|nr:M1 family aminopeptidase [Paraneptunicella aestuarii]UAA39265.1 aminopeptidase [Paraneptunicella aestuarii]
MLNWASRFVLYFLIASTPALAAIQQTKGDFQDKFRQLDEVLPTPNVYRNAAGEPGHQYWQQKVDYQIDVKLNEEARTITASETIHYHNNSPDTLRYLWLHLDQNRFRADSVAERSKTFGDGASRGPATKSSHGDQPAAMSFDFLRQQQAMEDRPLGFTIENVKDSHGNALKSTIVDTVMRVDLKTPLKSGESVTFSMDFSFNILEENAISARSGFEHFPKDDREGGNDIFLLAQWFPRLAAYTDYEAWTNKNFLGRGEFTLEFGDYDVAITVPSDHIVSATGSLQNSGKVLDNEQRRRLRKAQTAKRPVFIVTPEEALENEKKGSDKMKTWQFSAKNVRDFAWASSRKFIWDAKGYKQDSEENPVVMAMSFYPKEGGELWQKYSTEAVIHTMEVYSRFSFDYPYPVAQSVNGPVGGMEYPMITFNGPRTNLQKDGSRTYSLSEKRYLLGVIFHEIGHIYFPMTVNSDERQWSWMDEGLNSFLDAIAGREWDPNIPWGNEPSDVVDYMKSSVQVPLMTQSDSILNFGPNAYHKPATALNILRETILGRELFDFAFKEYSRRWKFKRPTPSDFFRTMEEASGVDLDWFWRGWFYTTDHVDISIDKVEKLRLDTENPDIDFERRRQENKDKPMSISVERNAQEGKAWVERNQDVTDFYDKHDEYTVTNKERNKYNSFMEKLEDWEREALTRAVKEDKNYYVLSFSNLGGLVMPIIMQLNYTDGSSESLTLPAEIWRRSPKAVEKLIITDKGKELQSVEVDPRWQTADVDINNNHFPRKILPSRIESYKSKKKNALEFRDIMFDSTTELKKDKEEDN